MRGTIDGTESGTSGKGPNVARIAKPWYRASHNGWYVTINKKMRSLGVKGRDSEPEAWESYARIKNAGPVDKASVADRLAAWLDKLRGRGVEEKTIYDYSRAVSWFIRRFPRADLATIEADDIAYRAGLETKKNGQPWSDSHSHNILAVVQAFIRFASKRIDFKIPLPAKASRGASALIDEMTWGIIINETSGDFRQLLRVMWETGARPSEIANLEADAIQWHSKTVSLVRHKNAKKNKRRVLAFNEAAMEVLAQQATKHGGKGYLFLGQRKAPFTAQAIGVRFDRLSKSLNIKVTAYGIRHTWANRALQQGFTEAQVAAVMGHSTTQMIQRHYSHLSDNAKAMLAVVNGVK